VVQDIGSTSGRGIGGGAVIAVDTSLGKRGNLELAGYAIAQETDSSRYIISSIQAARRAAEVSGSMLTYLGQSFTQQQPLDFAKTCHTGIYQVSITLSGSRY
jgi:hypothetical protein